MRLAAGDRLGPYQVVAPLGAGGMGEVYRAHDTRLNRDVAIKVLPEGAASDPDRRLRLEREAQAVAALSHPNVLAVFDTGTHDGQLYVVTELLEGETLRARLAGGALPVRKAIEIAVEIARGLAAAHDRQLVHRDLKPENIFLVSDGRVKILDFGLARHAQPPIDTAETVAAATDPGTILGTVGYMAPEQVRGGAIDARADLFAFGAVLYEMLTGQRAFRRATSAETMTAILHEDPPDVARVRTDLPAALDRIVRHCLEKNPSERFQTARDVAFALDALSGSDATTAGAQVHGTLPPVRARRAPVWLAAGTGLIAVAILAAWLAGGFGGRGGGAGTEPPITIGAATRVTTEEGLEIDPALSPDGRLLAYAAGHARRMRIFIRAVGGGRTIPLSEGADALERQPRWSPDGTQLLYLSGDAILVAPALGGASRPVAAGGVTSAAWSPDGKEVLVVRRTALSRVSLDDGTERVLGEAAEPVYHSCQWSPNGQWIACARGNAGSVVPGSTFGNIAPSAVAVMPATGGAFVDLTGGAGLNESPVWSSDARDLYFISNREGPRDIYVVRISAGGRAEGEPRRVTTGLGALALALSASGEHLAYVTYSARANIWSLPIPSDAPVDTSGARQVTTGNQVVEAMSVSNDGAWLLYDSTLHGNAEIFRVPIAGGASQRLTTDPAEDFAPALSPDGRFVAYHSWRSGTRDIFITPVDGASIEAVTSSPNMESYPLWSPDGSVIAFLDQAGSRGLFIVRRDAAGTWGPPRGLRTGTGRMAWLPDGRALACVRGGAIEIVSIETGQARAVYTPAPDSADPRAVGIDVSDDGRTIYFKSHDDEGRAMIWSVGTSGGRPRLLVRFMDPAHPSIRADFAAGAGQFFFTLEDRQADIVIADVVRRTR